ncbi:Cu(I)-responsive transcriptional regulator [Mangrovicoccus sp. HB161399]|uniref:Cu(I)-responsive transcriptional regulator n=1 Tax=Mangrovicoccus sp. HB161399 TaxID=2720392 RepID=UPI001556604F|nr:Cu(I)-responsive transcriptional regulator [Mangrovicoccus sp. HB161399]
MNIGAAAQASGLPVKTIRYYEEIGLVTPARAGNGYRDFGNGEVDRLRFLAQARSLGFSLEECRRLVALYSDDGRASREVRQVAQGHLDTVRVRIAELRALEATLEGLIERCPGDDSPHCAILDQLTSRETGG